MNNDSTDINRFIEKFNNTDGAILLDVRTAEEFSAFNIEKSINIPLDEIENTLNLIQDKSTPLFIYCRSGARSGRAEKRLKSLGYKNAVNIGGIIDYK